MTLTPHDALFGAVFSQPEHAAGALSALLPAEVAARVDWSTLELMAGTFVNDELQARVTDLVFRARLLDGQTARLCLLFEHQSRVDSWMPLRMLEYMVGIWNAHRRESPGTGLPVVIPVVLHHSERGWHAPTDLDHLFDVGADALAQFAAYEFVLEDLARRESADLHESAMTALGRLALWCLKRARHGQLFLVELGTFADAYHDAVAHGGPRALAPVMRYIHLVTELEADVVAGAMEENVSTEAKQAYVTSGQRLLAQGREQGLGQGREQGRRTLLLEQLQLKFGELPPTARTRVEAGSPEEIQRWAECVLTAEALEALFG